MRKSQCRTRVSHIYYNNFTHDQKSPMTDRQQQLNAILIHLHLLLAILDALSRAPEGVMLKDIAGTIVYRGLSAQRAIDWKSSSQRRQTQRLVVEARRMASHGYLGLLRQSRLRSFQTH